MCHPRQLSAKSKELTRSDRPIMQMSFRSTIRSMAANMKETFPPKTGMWKKQVLQDPGYVKDIKDACCILYICLIIFQLILYIVEDIEDTKTNYIEFI